MQSFKIVQLLLPQLRNIVVHSSNNNTIQQDK